MKTKSSKASVLVAVGFLCVFFVIAILLFLMSVGISNQEVRLRNQIEAVQLDNKNEFDLMWKKIAQVAQVTKEERASVEGIIVNYAAERGSNAGNGSFINAVREALPNIENKTFLNLQNIITASRDRFAGRQTQLIDLKRAHDDLLETVPSSWFVGDRGEIEIIVITSSETDKTFDTGRDDHVDVFGE